MFSGIIEELGRVEGISRRGNSALLCVQARRILSDVKIGDSIAVNGVCLTVIKNESGLLWFETMSETLRLTNLGGLRVREMVNLERSLKIGERLSGHFVTGHVDCVGIVRRRFQRQGNLCFEISVPASYLKYCLPKGSVAVDGISLTLAAKRPGGFQVYLIPHTLKNTTLGIKAASSRVNIEFDILAKKSMSY